MIVSRVAEFQSDWGRQPASRGAEERCQTESRCLAGICRPRRRPDLERVPRRRRPPADHGGDSVFRVKREGDEPGRPLQNQTGTVDGSLGALRTIHHIARDRCQHRGARCVTEDRRAPLAVALGPGGRGRRLAAGETALRDAARGLAYPRMLETRRAARVARRVSKPGVCRERPRCSSVSVRSSPGRSQPVDLRAQ